jgi:hypothetical protein
MNCKPKTIILLATTAALLLSACGGGIAKIISCAPNEVKRDSFDFTSITREGSITAYHDRPGQLFMDSPNGLGLEVSPGIDITILHPDSGLIQTGDLIPAREGGSNIIISGSYNDKVMFYFENGMLGSAYDGTIRLLASDGSNGNFTRDEVAHKMKSGELIACWDAMEAVSP